MLCLIGKASLGINWLLERTSGVLRSASVLRLYICLIEIEESYDFFFMLLSYLDLKLTLYLSLLWLSSILFYGFIKSSFLLSETFEEPIEYELSDFNLRSAISIFDPEILGRRADLLRS